VRKAVKQIVLQGLKRSRAFPMLCGSRWRRRRLLILAYHGISSEEEHSWNPSLFMSPEAFRQRMELLRVGRFTVLPLGEAVTRLYADDLPPRSVVITFDDGFYNFYEQAYPILSDYGYPATVYLTTFYCHYNKPIFLLSCSYLLWKGRHLILEPDGRVFEGSMDLRTSAGRQVALTAIRDHAVAQRLDREQENQLIEELAGRVQVDFKEFLSRRLLHLLNPQEVTYLASRAVDFEMHMHYHCSPDEKDTYLQHLRENRRLIEDMTGRRASHFCYPSGNHRGDNLPWLQEEAVESATTCESDLASPSHHRLLLPRLLDHSGMSSVEFESWLSGLGSLLTREGCGATADPF
jgi:peptidoglycan/xylan/chitin deacetylase (PgdA/CDA1 family)